MSGMYVVKRSLREKKTQLTKVYKVCGISTVKRNLLRRDTVKQMGKGAIIELLPDPSD